MSLTIINIFSEGLSIPGHQVWRFVSAYLGYVVGVTLALWLLTSPVDSLFQLEFWFGPRIALVASGEPLGDAMRLPFIPYFLGGLASLWDNHLFALMVKNLLVQLLLAYIMLTVWKRSRRKRSAAILICYVLTFPQLVRHGFSLIPEQGYQIAMLTFVFYGLIDARPGRGWIRTLPYALVAGLTFLIQSSAMVIGPVFCLLYFMRTRSIGVLALFSGVLAAAVLGWGVMNLSNTGEFAISSSADGYNFWKGNNELTLEYFPHRSLDAISHLAPRREEKQSEWEWNAECFRQGVEFNLENPGAGLMIAALRVYQIFISVTAEDSPSWGSARAPLKAIGVVYMVVFRILLLTAIALALRSIWRFWRTKKRDSGSLDGVEMAVCYLMFLGAYVAPYLVAWGTQRRLMPLIIPTCLYLWWVYEVKVNKKRYDLNRKTQGMSLIR